MVNTVHFNSEIETDTNESIISDGQTSRTNSIANKLRRDTFLRVSMIFQIVDYIHRNH